MVEDAMVETLMDLMARKHGIWHDRCPEKATEHSQMRCREAGGWEELSSSKVTG
jgi:hypothetical protein